MPDLDSQPEYYEQGLEAASQNFPEVSHRDSRAPEVAYHQLYQHQPYAQSYQSYHNVAITKPLEPSYVSQAGGSSPFPFSSTTAHSLRKEPRKILGCSVLVLTLSCVIALLSAAAIGLGAATGIQASRASDSENRAASLSMQLAAGPTATVTISPSPSATDFNTLTNGCTDNPDSVTDTNYTSFSLRDKPGIEFTRFCNKDTIHPPLLSLFAPDFETCIDACASYTKYIPTMFTKNVNTTCAAVSFVPLWTVKTSAHDGGAPGNCYLKPGPMVKSDLKDPNIGTECHAAILASP